MRFLFKTVVCLWLFLITKHGYSKPDLYLFDAYSILVNLVLFFSLFLVLFVTIFVKSKEIKLNTEITIYSILFSLFLMETILLTNNFKDYYHTRKDKFEIMEKKLNTAVDRRTKSMVIKDLAKNNINSFPIITPYMFLDEEIYFPLSTLSDSWLVSCNEGGNWLVYKSDKYGFRNHKSKYIDKINSIFIGDSFCWGSCVKDDETIPTVYDKLTNKNSLNFANTGNGPLISLGVMREFVTKFSPSKIFYLYYDGNDFPSDLSHEKKNKILISYLDNNFSQDLFNGVHNSDLFLRKKVSMAHPQNDLDFFQHLKNFFSFKAFLNLSRLRNSVSAINQYPNVDYTLLSKTFRSMRGVAKNIESEIIFIYLPSWKTLNGLNQRTFKKVREKVLEIAQENFQVLDMTKSMRSEQNFNKFFYYPESHYNEKGYFFVANQLAKFLKN